MNVGELVPRPASSEPFSRDRLRFLPRKPGGYVLTTVTGHILYIGLASSIAARFDQHLDSPAKTEPTDQGRAATFHWIEFGDIEALERGWLNAHRVAEGRLPLLNTLDSPVSY